MPGILIHRQRQQQLPVVLTAGGGVGGEFGRVAPMLDFFHLHLVLLQVVENLLFRNRCLLPFQPCFKGSRMQFIRFHGVLRVAKYGEQLTRGHRSAHLVLDDALEL